MHAVLQYFSPVLFVFLWNMFCSTYKHLCLTCHTLSKQRKPRGDQVPRITIRDEETAVQENICMFHL